MQIKRLAGYDVNINEATHEELIKLTSEICYKSKQDLYTLLSEAESVARENCCRKHGDKM